MIRAWSKYAPTIADGMASLVGGRLQCTVNGQETAISYMTPSVQQRLQNAGGQAVGIHVLVLPMQGVTILID